MNLRSFSRGAREFTDEETGNGGVAMATFYWRGVTELWRREKGEGRMNQMFDFSLLLSPCSLLPPSVR
jgi:hypothetical protein